LDQYFVAAHPLPAGTFLRDEDLRLKTVLPGELPPKAIADSEENRAGLRGALVRQYLDEGTAITQADLLRPRDRGFLAAVLETDTRAVTVAVDAVSGVAGLIWPGDRVDLILTQTIDKDAAPLPRRILSETILTDVRVIAVDQDLVRGPGTGFTAGSTAGRVARTVTLQVNSDQVQRVSIAQQLGQISLAVRAIDGKPTAPADMSTTDGGNSTLFSGDVSPALSTVDHPAGAKVHVIEGDKRNEVSFQ
jgi:pilus assembly protein CpaB